MTEKLFHVGLAPLAACKAGATCEAILVIRSLEGYKFNREYPTKFVAKASGAVTVDGTGTVQVVDKTSALVHVNFRGVAAGNAPITGALKFSVCTDDVCEIAAPAIAFDVLIGAP